MYLISNNESSLPALRRTEVANHRTEEEEEEKAYDRGCESYGHGVATRRKIATTTTPNKKNCKNAIKIHKSIMKQYIESSSFKSLM